MAARPPDLVRSMESLLSSKAVNRKPQTSPRINAFCLRIWSGKPSKALNDHDSNLRNLTFADKEQNSYCGWCM
ncbi:hypothetical protein TgHK011_010155 [Trichoderma gracile]|nr:hypothetical protein TgHK011_010155 [Trichoderma gracile]